MSAIYTDAADIPPAFPHPTGAATVINFNGVVSPFFNTTPNPTAPASTSPSSTPGSGCYYSDPSSSSSVSASASTSRLESWDSRLPPASPSRLETRDSALPSPRDFSLEAHQAEYRAHAYLANEAIVKTKLAADKYLQNLFKNPTEPEKNILRAASAASRARLQNPFAYNNPRSSGSSGSSGSSSGSSSYYSGSSGSSYPASRSGTSSSSPSPSASTAREARSTAAQPNAVKNAAAPAFEATSDSAIWPFGNLAISPPASPAPADDDKPLTEADFADCIKLEEIISKIDATATPQSTAPRSGAILGGVLVNSTTTATPDAKTPPGMAVPRPDAEQPDSVPPEATEAAPTPAPPSDLAMWQFDHLTISPCETTSPPAPVEPLPKAPTEAEFRALEKKLTKISGRPFTIGRSANIHDPATVAYFEDHALYIQNQLSMARAREAHFDQVCGTTWPHGP